MCICVCVCVCTRRGTSMTCTVPWSLPHTCPSHTTSNRAFLFRNLAIGDRGFNRLAHP